MGLPHQCLKSLVQTNNKAQGQFDLSTNISQRFRGDGIGPTRVVCQLIGLVKILRRWRGFTIRGEDKPPMGILCADVFEDKSLCKMKKENTTQHIAPTDVLNHIGSSPFVPCSNSKMMIGKTCVSAQVRLGSSETKNAGLSIMRDLVAD